MEKKDENKNIIKVSNYTKVDKLFFYCQKLLNKKKYAEINLCAFGDAIEILELTIKKLKSKYPKLSRLNKYNSRQYIWN